MIVFQWIHKNGEVRDCPILRIYKHYCHLDSEVSRWVSTHFQIQETLYWKKKHNVYCSRQPISYRIYREIKELTEKPTEGMIVTPDASNLRHFKVLLSGPKDSPFEKGVFRLNLTLPENYPEFPPSVIFQTKGYHPNINDQGGICLDTLQKAWTPVLGIRTTLLSIQSLLAYPYLGHYLAMDIGKEWEKNEPKAKKNAEKWTKRYAMVKEDVEAMEALRVKLEAKKKKDEEDEARKKNVGANKAEASTSKTMDETLRMKLKAMEIKEEDGAQDRKKNAGASKAGTSTPEVRRKNLGTNKAESSTLKTMDETLRMKLEVMEMKEEDGAQDRKKKVGASKAGTSTSKSKNST